MKKILFFLTTLIFITLFTTSAHALVDVTYNFNTNSVDALAYDCLDSTCSRVKPFSGSFPNDDSTTNGKLTIRYPSTLASQHGYALFFTSTGFVPREGRATWHSFGDPTLFTTTFDITLNKIANCRALIDDLTILNIDTPNVPVIIETKASLDALTHSAFTILNNEVAYIPEELKDEFYSSDVRVTLVIKDEAGNVVDRQITEFAGTNTIFADETKPVHFEFLPRKEGRFTAKVTTEVIDNQCSSAQPQSSSKDFTIQDALPRNECFTLLNGLQVFPQDSAEAFSGETTVLIETINRAGKQLTLLEQETGRRQTIGLDNNFKATFTIAGNSLTLTLKPNDSVQVEGLPTPNEALLPQGSTFTTFSAISVSKNINFQFEKTSTHASNNPFDQAILTPLQTSIHAELLDATNAIAGQLDFTAGANPDATNPGILGPFALATTKTGLHTLIVTGQATGTQCTGLTNTPETLRTEVFVQTPQTHTASIQVVDAATGNPVELASILLSNKAGTTDKNGKTVFAGLRPNTYTYSISHPSFTTQSGTVNIDNSDVTILVSLQRNGNGNPPDDDDNDNDDANNDNGNNDGSEDDTDKPEAALKIESIRYIETISAGSPLRISTGLTNNGDKKLDNIKISATILELGTRRRSGPFDLNKDERESRTLLLDLPTAEPNQEYTIRIEIGNEDVRRVIHRPLFITE